ncbi:MAG: hypothetical protein NTW86_33125, partial [Candidatus Sumerlaeota bacterium]|nr:hypothetical protein [Candidatus Sumerlaeota bacterium]
FVSRDCACFKIRLEDTLASEMGKDYFEEQLAIQRSSLGIPKRKHALKNPVVIQKIISRALQDGKDSATLSQIVEKIVALRC